jgi:hypothetical protein
VHKGVTSGVWPGFCMYIMWLVDTYSYTSGPVTRVKARLASALAPERRTTVELLSLGLPLT